MALMIRTATPCLPASARSRVLAVPASRASSDRPLARGVRAQAVAPKEGGPAATPAPQQDDGAIACTPTRASRILSGLAGSLRLLGPSATAACAWLALVAPPSLAAPFSSAPDDPQPYNELVSMGSGAATDDTALFDDTRVNFTALLVMALGLYWVFKSIDYLKDEDVDEGKPNALFKKQQQQKPGQAKKDAPTKLDAHDKKVHRLYEGEDSRADDPFGDHGHANAPVRSFKDVKASPGNEREAHAMRASSLAKSAAFRVAMMTKESQPRIHSTLHHLVSEEKVAGAGRPHSADVDPVVDMVWQKVSALRQTKGADATLNPRELAAMETLLLEDVAAKYAADEVAQLRHMAEEGKLWAAAGEQADSKEPAGRR